MKFFDLFAGIGGFRVGLKEVGGYKCVGWCEKDKFAQKSYKAIHQPTDEYFESDAKNIKTYELPDFELLTAGFPCSDFSIAGNKEGLDGVKGTLFYEIARICRDKRPSFFILENVRGLLTNQKGETFGRILKVLDGIGYDLQWQVLRAKDFGLPQKRKRVFIVGNIRKKSRPKIFPITKYDRVSPTPRSQPLPTLTATDYKGPSKQRNSIVMYDENIGLRKLTPKESWRLQGFTDEQFEKAQKVCSNTQLYRQAGNSLPVPIVKEIGRRLKNDG